MAGGKCFLVYDDATIEEVRQYIHEQLDTRWVDLEC